MMRPTVNGILSILAATVWIGWFGYVVMRDRANAKTKLREHLTPYRNAFRDRWISEEHCNNPDHIDWPEALKRLNQFNDNRQHFQEKMTYAGTD